MPISGTEFGAWVTAGTLVVTTIGAQFKTSRELKSQREEMAQRKQEADSLQTRPDVNMAKQAFEAMKNLADSYEEEIKRRDAKDTERDAREKALVAEMARLRTEIFSLRTILNKNGISFPDDDAEVKP